VRVDRGHLVLEDGIGTRRFRRFPRVGHGIRRLVIIGSDGVVSLSALRWLADQDAAFVMLERDGSVLACTGPSRTGDARLRRAQSLAVHSGLAVEIARELISRKLTGQEKVTRELLLQPAVADVIASNQQSLQLANNLSLVRQFEAQAAQAYWAGWRTVPILFPQRDVNLVPDHWRTFGTRKSPISGSPRLAANPPNAMLNYLYAVLESESRLALAALGLDPAIGFLHVDTPGRDSLACDLMEAIRPEIDSFLISWIHREPLRRNWFFEESDGNCRLMGTFAVRLSETSSTWARAVAPIAEWVARKLWSRPTKRKSTTPPPTRLTEDRRRAVKGSSRQNTEKGPSVLRICRICGNNLLRGRKYCKNCSARVASKNLKLVATLGRAKTLGTEAQSRRSETMRRQQKANIAWKIALPSWLNLKFYSQEIQPALDRVPIRVIASTLAISEPYAAHIQRGIRIPHQRHWQKLTELVEISNAAV
jgi:CRISPR-associated endonuclease Cas1